MKFNFAYSVFRNWDFSWILIFVIYQNAVLFQELKLRAYAKKVSFINLCEVVVFL